MRPVSYTHLDVYKRQDFDIKAIFIRYFTIWLDIFNIFAVILMFLGNSEFCIIGGKYNYAY